MQSVQNCVQTSAQFGRAPLRASLAHITSVDQLTFLVLNDRDVYARKAKLRAILEQLTPRQRACLVSRYTR